MTALVTATASRLAEMLAAGEVSAREVAEAHLERIEAVDADVHAFLHVCDERAVADATAVDDRRAAGETLGPLAGVPLALKDVFVTKDVPTTCGSRILEGWVPPYDATVTARLRDAGVVVLGKTNMDEFAMGSSTENSAFGPTRNPWDIGRIPGGSSGGSSAALAAFMAPLAVGTDTGGSIRQPAAVTGTVGMKPTYGQVSRYGLIAFASSLDQAGPMARTVEDAALLHTVLAGHDPCDSTSIPEEPPDVLDGLRDGLDGLKLGVVRELQGEGYEPGVAVRFAEALERLAGLGAEIAEVSLPHAPYGLPAYYLIAPSEASSNLARYDGVRYGLRVGAATAEEMNATTRATGFGDEVKRRVMIGTYALSAGYYDAYYLQAGKVRTLIRRDFEEAFETVDLLCSPTTPNAAFPVGEKADDPLAMYLNDVATVPANLAGLPAISVPCGLDERGLPVGLQLMGPALREDLLFRAAWAFEADLGFDPTPRGDNAVEVPT